MSQHKRGGRGAAWRWIAGAALPIAALLGAAPAAVEAQPPGGPAAVRAEVPVEEFTLDNGMKFLLVRRPEQATVMGGWVAHVGSANERPGITGVAHFFEHMMFKGSRILGTKDAVRDAEILAEQEALQEQIRELYRVQRARWRKGEIDDPFDPAARPPALVDLEARFAKLVEEQRALMVKDEFDKIYTEAGGSGMNATTNWDSTVYWITVPANKLELWFWMESERLLQPVFREFYSERDVVQEERRLRVESTPTGPFEEQLNAMFWTSHPYNWDTIGWMSDLKSLSMADAQEFFSTYYAPNNLTAALVGNFEVAEVRRLAEAYFGRIPRGERSVPDVVTLEEKQLAEKRMNAECDCQPQVTVQFHTTPFQHKDDYVLEVISGLLNGQTGRLNKQLVLERKIASSAFAAQQAWKYNGFFVLSAETQGEATPAEVEAALLAELARLAAEPVPAEELQKVKNQTVAGSFRNLQNPFFLLVQLLFYDGWGDWNHLNTWAGKTLAVTPEDVQRVAAKYFTRENRTVATYQRKAGTSAEPVPEELAGLPAEQQQMFLGQLRQIRAAGDAAQLEQAIAGLEAQKGALPPEYAAPVALMERTMHERLAELRAAQAEGVAQ
ncbi:MAG: insulinase family protein [Thermoanaerobaculia bacterium]|nr:insulinase family protein [Thermoanaerobaculia bacterium]